MPHAPDRVSLVADVGGTNTRVALAEDGRIRDGTLRRYRNADHASLAAVINAYLADEGSPDCAGACVAVAGPVRDGVGRLTNLDWTMDAETLGKATGAECVAILNDLVAQGHALGHIAPEALVQVVAGNAAPPPGAPRLVIGIGTGFNAAPVHEVAAQGSGRAGRIVVASECGHVTMPVRSADDLDLMHFVEAAHGFAGVEDVLSGRGVERIDAWLASRDGGVPGRSAAAIMAGLEAGEPRAELLAATVVRLMGTVAGDLALIHLPFGGIYFIGGVARAFSAHFDRFGFAAAFRDKGRFGPFLESFPVSVIEDDYAALTGCARHLLHLMTD